MPIQSAWWIVYYIHEDWEPRYLIIKRYAISKKVERIAPKWKIQPGESNEMTALREVSEETWLALDKLQLKQKIWQTQLRNWGNSKWMEKDVTYFLIEYSGNPDDVNIIQWEWYIWNHKRATIAEILSLVYYEDIRELFRKTYIIIKEQKKKSDIKKDFMDKLDL